MGGIGYVKVAKRQENQHFRKKFKNQNCLIGMYAVGMVTQGCALENVHKCQTIFQLTILRISGRERL